MALAAHLPKAAMNFADDLHDSGILESLRHQQETGRFCDVVIHVHGRQFPAHRNVLAASSPYFDSILKMHKVVQENLTVTCQNHAAFQALLRYMYTGAVSIHRGIVGELLQLANHFLIFRLKNYCAQFLDRHLNISNCLIIRDVAETYNTPCLLNSVLAFIRDHVSEVLENRRLLLYPLDKLVAFLSDKSLGLPKDSLVLRLVTRWVSHDAEEREGEFRYLLTFVDWKEVNGDTLYEHMRDEPLFSENRRCLYFFLDTLEENSVPLLDCTRSLYEQLKLEFSCNAIDRDAFMDRAVSAAIRGVRDAVVSAGADDRETDASADPEPRQPEDVDSETPSTDYGDDSLQERIADDSSTSDLDLECDEMQDGSSNGRLHALLTKVPYDTKEELAAYEDGDGNPDVRPGSDGGSAAAAASSQWKEGVKCPHCSYVGYGATRLEHHVARAHAKDVTYKCGLCGFTCKWNREYYCHMKNHLGASGGVPPYRCDVCSYRCDRIQLVLLHRMKHTDEKPYSCGACDYRCRQKTNLVAHMRSHTGERPFRCERCGRAFTLKCTLEQHLQSHRADRPYLCDVCGFTAKYQSHLISHRRLHTGNVYRCQFVGCTYVSPKKSQLEAHTRTHTAVRSHVCPVCGRAFIERSHLVRHERIHLDDKPFKCPECDYSSSRRDKLKEHQQKHHGENATAKGPYRPRRTPRTVPASSRTSYDETLGADVPRAREERGYAAVREPETGPDLSQLRPPTDVRDDVAYAEPASSDLGLSEGEPAEVQTSLAASAPGSATSSAADLNGLNSFMAFF